MKAGSSLYAFCSPSGALSRRLHCEPALREQIDNVALILNEEDRFAGGRFHSPLLSPKRLRLPVKLSSTNCSKRQDYINRRTIFHVEFLLEKGPWLCLTESFSHS